MISVGEWVGLCPRDEMEDGSMRAFECGEVRIALYAVDGEIYATNNICSHAFTLLTDGWLEDGLVECPLHGAQFDVRNGEVARGPADCPVSVFKTRTDNGMIEVLLQS